MVYQFPAYVPASAAAVGVVAGIAGFLLIVRRASLKPILLLFGVALFAGGILAPMLALDRVVLDHEKLEQTTGFWFAPTVKGFRLAETSSVKIGTARDRKNRAYEVWIVQMKNGQTREIDPDDLWERNESDIIQRLRERGIKVER